MSKLAAVSDHCEHCECECDECDDVSSLGTYDTHPEPNEKPPALWPVPLCDCHHEAVLAWNGDAEIATWVYQCRSNCDSFNEWTGIDQCEYETKYDDWKKELDKNKRMTNYFFCRPKKRKRRKITDYFSIV